VGNQVHWHRSRLNEAACEVDALGGEPRQRRAAYLGPEPPVQGGDAEMSVPGQIRDGQRRVQPGKGPLQGPGQRRLSRFGDWLLDELLLPAVAEGGEHQPAADEVSDPVPVVEADRPG